MQFDDLSRQVIGCAIEVHKTLGPGLLESTYEKCLAHELGLAGLSYTAQELLASFISRFALFAITDFIKQEKAMPLPV